MMQTLNYQQNQYQLNNKSQDSNVQKNQWKLEDFELGPILGKGKFSQVYLAREHKSGYILALKVMDKEFLQKNGLEDQIKREILLQKCVKHENVLQLYGFFHDEKKIYLILEYAEQGDLYSLVHTYQGKKLDESLTKHFIKQVINALQFLHQHNIIHRDLKPENLLISNGDIKLADFGLAAQQNFSKDFQQSIQSLQQYQTEKRKTFCGTLDYISPEMFMKKGHDNKIDIWSIGVLIYELSAGYPPFEGNSYNETMEKVIQCQNLKYPIFFSGELVDLLKQILVLKPENRLSFQKILEHKWFQQRDQQ